MTFWSAFCENLIYEEENSWNMAVAFQAFFFCTCSYANIISIAKDLCHELLCNGARLLNTLFKINVSMIVLYIRPEDKLLLVKDWTNAPTFFSPKVPELKMFIQML